MYASRDRLPSDTNNPDIGSLGISASLELLTQIEEKRKELFPPNQLWNSKDEAFYETQLDEPTVNEDWSGNALPQAEEEDSFS
jgi:hypothetical protein